jgi:hypothetical protein
LLAFPNRFLADHDHEYTVPGTVPASGFYTPSTVDAFRMASDHLDQRRTSGSYSDLSAKGGLGLPNRAITTFSATCAIE